MKRASYAVSICLLLTSMLLFDVSHPRVFGAKAQAEGETKIVFVSQDRDTNAMTLNIADADGANVTPLVIDGYFFEPMLSPDGRQIVFDGEHPTTRRRTLFIINTDGTHLRPLVETRRTVRPTGPIAWSPDGSQLIFGFLDGNRYPAGFYRMNADGSDLALVAFENLPRGSNLTAFADTWVAWSPDGSQIAIKVRTDNDTGRINGVFYVARPDGGGAVPFVGLNADGAASNRWAWSPDGSQILLYSAASTAFDEGVYIANADGSNLELLVDAARFPSSLAWCSDHRQIVFVATDAGGAMLPGGDLWVIHPDGSGLRSLNIAEDVSGVGVSCGVVPADVILPASPTSFMDMP